MSSTLRWSLIIHASIVDGELTTGSFVSSPASSAIPGDSDHLLSYLWFDVVDAADDCSNASGLGFSRHYTCRGEIVKLAASFASKLTSSSSASFDSKSVKLSSIQVVLEVWMQVLCTGDGTIADGAGCAEQVW
ncbi:uncharacterized protein LOC112200699 isoform X2 [Rosa chinensis]|uniref:uncharacterized protein LOC112200671 isoform X2 n=1 Tax=Rosa chinensis TaxID=74649 RepID=UPI000D08E74A|nr:uncharacterized protein LOC112200671 isoform X2 [Rosa chinensis]XP_024197475.1 uncharacterized protein LOC112200698 isoform X2 [Rosa chinensis]XP_024197478.1 uncharacterized protein LOC112200699 isoform X2 [Rosa chinensis]